MEAPSFRLPFSLHALVAEARRRARRRRVQLAIAVTLVGVAAGAVYVAHPFGSVASPTTPARFRPGYMNVAVGGARGLDAWPVAGISASSHDTAWVVGSDLAWRWDGHAWRSVPLPRAIPLQSVSSIARNDAWALGGSAIEHWDGVRWSVARLPRVSGGTLQSISAAGPHNVWAVGTISTAIHHRPQAYYRDERPFLLHWNGTSWSRQSLPWARVGMAADRVVAAGPSGVWVVSSLYLSKQAETNVIEYWNGIRWRAVPAPFGPQDPILGFSATAGDDAWAVGSYAKREYGVLASEPLAAHWNGFAWRFTRVPTRPGHHGSLLADVVSVRPNDVWAIGQIQPVHPYEAWEPRLFMLHWAGSSWTVTPGSAQSSFDAPAAIAATSDGTAWAVTNCGNDNILLGWNGARWRVVPHPPDQHWLVHGPARSSGMSSCASSGSSG